MIRHGLAEATTTVVFVLLADLDKRSWTKRNCRNGAARLPHVNVGLKRPLRGIGS